MTATRKRETKVLALRSVFGLHAPAFYLGCITLGAGCSNGAKPAVDAPVAVHTQLIPSTYSASRLKMLSRLSHQKRNVRESEALYQASLLKDRQFVVRSLAFSSDGKVLASAGLRDAIVRHPALQLIDTRTGNLMRVITGHPIEGLAFSPDNKVLVSGGPKLKVWSYKEGLLKIIIPAAATSLAFSPDGRWLAAADSGTNRLDLWDTHTWTLKQRIGFFAEVGAVIFSPDGTKVLSSTMLVLDVGTGQVLRAPMLGYHGGSPEALSGDGKMLVIRPYGSEVSGTPKLKLQLWDTQTGRIRWSTAWRVRHRDMGLTRGLAFSPDGGMLATAASSHKIDELIIKLFDTQTGRLESVIQRHSATDPLGAEVIAFSPDGKMIAVGGIGVGHATKIVKLH